MGDERYKNGKIYRLLCADGHYYIGSTINNLKNRLANHKISSKDSKAKVYTYINSVGWDNVKIELVEKYPCLSKEALIKQEAFYINEMKEDDFCLNTNKPHVTKEEREENKKAYYESHKDEIKAKHKEYYADPAVKEKTDAYQAEYRKQNAEKRRAYTNQYKKDHSEQVKQACKSYYEQNKETIKAKNQAYVLANKEVVQERQRKWAEKKREEQAETLLADQEARKQLREAKTQQAKMERETPVQCECGGTYQPYRKSRHDAGKKHLAFLTS